MATPIIPNLSFGPNHSSLPPPGQLLLITDHLDSPAEFILHRILATHLKEIKNARTVILSFALEFAHWRAIAAKSNINLAQCQSSGSLTFIDGLGSSTFKLFSANDGSLTQISCPPLFGQENGDGLRSLYIMIDKLLAYPDQPFNDETHPTSAQQTVIIDDISILEMIGVPTLDLTRFVRALRALCRSRSASFIVRAHAVPSSETSVPFDSEILRSLLDSCHAHVEVRPLASGRSGAVSGEVAVHRGGLTSDDAFVTTGRKSAMQYRLSDGGVVFFQRGMGAGVL